jgi:hypothetical protein
MVGSAFKTTRCNYNAGGNIIITSGTSISLAAFPSSNCQGADGKETIRSDADDDGGQINDDLLVITCGLGPKL